MKNGCTYCGKGETGFTLLEVLVATAILGTAVAALFSLLSGSLSNARRLQVPEQVLLLAHSQLNELLAESQRGLAASPVLPLEEKVQGRWNEQIRWEAMATRVPSAQPSVAGTPILVRIELDAFWNSGTGGTEKQLSLETYQLWQEPIRVAP
ncbi:MAG: prepilin-type N-terminal cleavage/methylation domain-containing protein [Acidobacteria bacterium]|nr:prepilin-type N-terminal cleavage/methylation domain-containing protein [Acidobacteriota bacterium]